MKQDEKNIVNTAPDIVLLGDVGRIAPDTAAERGYNIAYQ